MIWKLRCAVKAPAGMVWLSGWEITLLMGSGARITDVVMREFGQTLLDLRQLRVHV